MEPKRTILTDIPEADLHLLNIIYQLSTENNISLEDVIQMINQKKTIDMTKSEVKRERHQQMMQMFTEALTTRPNASRYGVADEIAQQYGITSVAVRKVMVKAGLWDRFAPQK